MGRVRHMVAGLTAAMGAIAVGNAASAAPAHLIVARADSDAQDPGAPLTFDDLRDLVTQFESSGEVSFAGARRLEVCLDLAQHNVVRGTPSGATFWLEQFKETASQPRYVPSESAQAVLIAAADHVIGQLSGDRPDNATPTEGTA